MLGLFQICRFEATYIAASTVKHYPVDESIFLGDAYLINTRSFGSCWPYICHRLGISRTFTGGSAGAVGVLGLLNHTGVSHAEAESFTGAFQPFLEHDSRGRRNLRRKAELSSCRTSTCCIDTPVLVFVTICDRTQLRARGEDG